jgi:hypothetical protein
LTNAVDRFDHVAASLWSVVLPEASDKALIHGRRWLEYGASYMLMPSELEGSKLLTL